ncbi:predicted protein [Postia placenta Mad-698-R]|nr:predicted protein [Postia placenta Mad-698-R]
MRSRQSRAQRKSHIRRRSTSPAPGEHIEAKRQHLKRRRHKARKQKPQATEKRPSTTIDHATVKARRVLWAAMAAETRDIVLGDGQYVEERLMSAVDSALAQPPHQGPEPAACTPVAHDISMQVMLSQQGTTSYPHYSTALAMWSQKPAFTATRSATTFEFTQHSTLTAARRIALTTPDLHSSNHSQTSLGILSYASRRRPGGGYLRGGDEQHERIARHSSLVASLTAPAAQEFYKEHRTFWQEDGSGLQDHAMVYSPGVVVFRRDRDDSLALVGANATTVELPPPADSIGGEFIAPYLVNVVSSVPVNAAAVRSKHVIKPWEKEFFENGIRHAMKERMARILRLLEKEGNRVIVLGAFGCESSQNKVETIAEVWAELLVSGHLNKEGHRIEARFKDVFEKVVFAVPGKLFEPFRHAFELRVLETRISEVTVSVVIRGGMILVPPRWIPRCDLFKQWWHIREYAKMIAKDAITSYATVRGSPPGVGLSAETCRRGAMEDTDAQQDHSSLPTPCNPLDASKASSDALPGQSANEDSINVPNHQHPTTPPRPTAPACSSNKPDTPAVCSDSFRTGSLSEREDAVLADIRCLRCMSVDEFIAIFLPTLPDDIDIEHEKKEADLSLNEDKLFERIVLLVQQLATEASKMSSREQTFEYALEPTKIPTTVERKSSFRPDGVFCKKGGSSSSYYDIALPMEFKIFDADKSNYDEDYLRHATHHVGGPMSDPSPTDSGARNVYESLSLLCFCDSDEDGMGSDHRTNPWPWQASLSDYVGDECYETIEELQGAADVLLGRGVRVFFVKDAQGNSAVLKDIWLEDGRMTEFQIYTAIVEDIARRFPDGGKEKADRFLMQPSKDSKSFPVTCDEKPTQQPMKGLPVLGLNVEEASICHRRYYRVVFKQHAIPLFDVDDLGLGFQTLDDVMEVLQLVHGSGWVHRDISPSNSRPYLFQGTLQFMAAETMDREYLFLPVQLEERSTMEQCTAFILLNQRLNKTAAESTPNVGTFHHNYLHDIESMWWCGVWLLFFNCPKGYDEAQNDVEKRQAATMVWITTKIVQSYTTYEALLASVAGSNATWNLDPDASQVHSDVQDTFVLAKKYLWGKRIQCAKTSNRPSESRARHGLDQNKGRYEMCKLALLAVRTVAQSDAGQFGNR